MDEITVGSLVGWKEYPGELFGVVAEIKDDRAYVSVPALTTNGWVELDRLYVQVEEMGW